MTPRRWVAIILTAVFVVLCLSSVSVAEELSGSQALLLDTTSYWRAHLTLRAPVYGTATTAKPLPEQVKLIRGGERVTIDAPLNQPHSALPSGGWVHPDFDDSSWYRGRGPYLHGGRYGAPGYGFALPMASALLCLRGKFVVRDPSRVKDLRFSGTYRGGIVVYLNGREVARQHLPGGDIDLETLAREYPREAYISANETTLDADRLKDEASLSRLDLRLRHLTNVSLPEELLRRGTNILALEIHRTPFHPDHPRLKGQWSKAKWSTVGLLEAKLSCANEGEVLANTAQQKGLYAWNVSPLQEVYTSDYAGPEEELRPIVLVGAPNGVASGQVVLSCDQPIKGVTGKASKLRAKDGQAGIPASRIVVRYPLPGVRYGRFDALSAQPPTADTLVQPVWVTVNIPPETASGNYQGTLTVTANHRHFQVPLELKVCAWTLPDPRDYVTFVDVIQSPDSVALQYQVPLWSDEHFEYMRESFKLLGRLGNKTVYVPLIKKTYFGNTEAMVRWVKQEGAGFRYDFSIMDKYLDVAEQHMGKPDIVCFIVWDPYLGGSFVPRSFDLLDDERNRVAPTSGILFDVLDPTTGKVTEHEGPPYQDARAREFWGPLARQLMERLTKRGLDKAMVLGVSGDMYAPKVAVMMWKGILPQSRWMTIAHKRFRHLYGEPVGVTCHAVAYAACDPAVERYFGWNRPEVDLRFSRGLSTQSLLVMYRGLAEFNVMAGRRGFGFVAGDYWPVVNGQETVDQRYKGTLKSQWKAYATYGFARSMLLSPGPDGAISNIRLEMMREGIQECEARIFVEKALVDEVLRVKLGEVLTERCQALLDERTRYMRWSRCSYEPGGVRQILASSGPYERLLYVSSGWQEHAANLYSLAAGVEKALTE